MLNSIRSKFILIFSFFFVFIGILISIYIVQHMRDVENFNKSIKKTSNLNKAIELSLASVYKTIFQLQRPFFFQNERELIKLKLLQTSIDESIEVFYIYLKMLTWGTESEAFKRSSHGITYALRIKENIDKEMKIDDIPLSLRQNAGLSEIYFSAFLKYNKKALKELESVYSLLNKGLIDDSNKILSSAINNYRISHGYAEMVLRRLNDLHGDLESIVNNLNNNLKNDMLIGNVSLIKYSVTILLIFIAIVWLATKKMIIMPMEFLTKQIKGVSAENLHSRDLVVLESEDELGILSVSFKQMLDLLKNALVSRDSLMDEVSNRIKLEKKLTSVNSFNSALITALPFAIEIVDMEGKILFANEMLIDLTKVRDPIGKKKLEVWIGNERGNVNEVVMNNRYYQLINADIQFDDNPATLEIFYDITERKDHENIMSYENSLHSILVELLSIKIENLTFNECLQISLNILLKAHFCASLKKGAIFLSDEARNHFSLMAHQGIDRKSLSMYKTVPFGKCLCGITRLRKEIIFAGNINEKHCIMYENMKPHGHYCVPVLVDDDLIGVIDINISSGHKESETDTRFLKAASTIIAWIIQRKQYETELNSARMSAEAANDAKSLFLTNMSHELRTPLHGILGFSKRGILKVDSGEREKMKVYFNEIKKSGEKQLALVNDILDLSKLESGKEEFIFSKGNLKSIMLKVVNDLNVLAGPKNIKIIVKDSEFVPVLDIDNGKILSVIENLLSNAIKFSFEGSTIILSYEDSDDCVIFKISNSGVLIPKDELDKVFDKFYQSTKTRTNAGGTGLGLAICKKIIDGHGGSIQFELGEGDLVIACVSLPKRQKETAVIS